jgi:uncharacterized protein YaaR (DUF327 family)
MTSFGSKTAEEQQALIKNIGDLLVKHGIPADVKTVKEVVCNLKGNEVENNTSVVIKKDCPQSLKKNIDEFKEAVKEFTEGVEGIQIQLICAVGAGSKYQTIENVTNIENDEKINLDHDGQAWLIDFWATWCPPCQ